MLRHAGWIGMLALALALTLTGLAFSPIGDAATPEPATTPAAPVLVELFTSEGCSSCPPADRTLSGLLRRSPVPNVEIIALAWHVDYWDQLGWKDALASREATDRQRWYARLFGRSAPATPEMVVDGRAGFVGSDAARATTALRTAAGTPARRIALSFKVAGAGGNAAAEVQLELPAGLTLGPGRTADVSLALTEDGIENRIGGGENAGRTLRHDAVVRRLVRLATLRGPGDQSRVLRGRVALMPELRRENARFVAWAQQGDDGRVLAVGQRALAPRRGE